MEKSRRRAKITKKLIQSIDGRKGHRYIVVDTELPGFQMVIGEKTKTYILEKRIKGVTKSQRKFTIGQYPALNPEEARDIAERWALLCRDGQDPTKVVIEKSETGTTYALKKSALEAVTVRKAFELHFEYAKLLPRTKYGYVSSMKVHLADWIDTPLHEIDISMVTMKGNHIEETVSANTARTVMHHFRAAWNSAVKFCQSKGLDCPGNPLNLMKVNQIYQTDPNKIVIPFQRVGQFIDILEQLKNDSTLTIGMQWTIKVYLLSLFLGMRNGEARMLKWKYLDMKAGFFKLPGQIVKNKKTHIKPICKYALGILEEMLAVRKNEYVFPTPSTAFTNKGKHISAYRDVQKIVIDRMGEEFEFTPHATRRTFISLADGINTPRTVLKALVNHISGDVTDGYCVEDFNPKQDGPYLARIEKAFLELRDRHRRGEDVPELVSDILPKPKDQATAALHAEILKMKEKQGVIDHLKAELAKTKNDLQQTAFELAFYKKQAEEAQRLLRQVQQNQLQNFVQVNAG